jgi:hypothetical protein
MALAESVYGVRNVGHETIYSESPVMLICRRCNKEPITSEGAKHCDTCRRLCAKCGVQRKAQRSSYCADCRNAYARAFRPKYADLSEEEKHKNRCRSYAHTYLKRGLIERKGCEVCGQKAQMHHEDYNKPLRVRWFCARHHHYLHHPIVNPKD